MKKSAFAVLLTTLAILPAGTSADTLHLRSGQTVEGTLLSADTRQITFLGSGGQPIAYFLTDVESITFNAGPVSLPAAPTPARAPAPPPRPTQATVFAGTTLLVSMSDSLNTKETRTGQIFTATLATNLMTGDILVARKGTTVHGQVMKSENARRLTGKSELQLELTNIVINGVPQPISTSGFQQKGSSEGAQTVKKTAVGAGLGAAIGAISGNAGKGAAIGAVSGVGISLIKKGQPINIPSETLLEFTLKLSATLPVGN